MRYPNTSESNRKIADKFGVEKLSEWSLLAGRIVRRIKKSQAKSEDEFWQEIRSTITSHYAKDSEESEFNRIATKRLSFKQKALKRRKCVILRSK